MEIPSKETYKTIFSSFQIKGQIDNPLTKYGLMRKNCLEYNHPAKFNLMLLEGTLYPHCKEVKRQINHKIEIQVSQMKKRTEKKYHLVMIMDIEHQLIREMISIR